MMQLSYLKENGETKYLCKRHQHFDCGCGGRPKDYTDIDSAICRVLEIYASPDKPLKPSRIQRMITFFGIERPFIYRDLSRLESKRVIQRNSCRSGYYLCA